MKTDDLNKIKEELEEKIKKNNEIIAINDEKMRMLNNMQFESKASITLVLSFFSYILIAITTAILAKSEIIGAIASTIPLESVPYIFLGSSIGLGTICRKILDCKFKVKERTKPFRKIKTQSEKFKEEIRSAIEIEKAKNRNKAISDSYSYSYDIIDENLSQNREETQKKVESLSKILKEKYEELDVFSTQQILYDKFWNIIPNGDKLINMMTSIAKGIVSGLCFTICSAMPFITMSLASGYNVTPLSMITNLFAPLTLGTIGACGYLIKRNKIHEKTYKVLNSELGKNALSDKITEEEQNIKDKIERKIRKISNIETQLQIQKRNMESFIYDAEKKTLDKSAEKENAIEEKRTNNISRYSRDESVSPLMNDLFTENMENNLSKAKSLTLKKNFKIDKNK